MYRQTEKTERRRYSDRDRQACARDRGPETERSGLDGESSRAKTVRP